MPIIIFTDESSVCVNLNGSFYEKDPHPIQCMVLGAIGPRGFRTTLVRINAITYINMLQDNNIRGQIVSDSILSSNKITLGLIQQE